METGEENMRKKIFKNKTMVIAIMFVAALFIGLSVNTAVAIAPDEDGSPNNFYFDDTGPYAPNRVQTIVTSDIAVSTDPTAAPEGGGYDIETDSDDPEEDDGLPDVGGSDEVGEYRAPIAPGLVQTIVNRDMLITINIIAHGGL